MTIKNVTVAGSGVLGYQIAFQAAFHHYKVTVYDISDEVLEKAKAKFNSLSEALKNEMNATDEQLALTFNNLYYSSDLAEAVKDADLLIESVPENPQIKQEFYEKLAAVAPEKTIFATNTSTLLPSTLAPYTGRPNQFIALHFANDIRKYNTAEIMGHSGTDQAVFDLLVSFAKSIGMVALPINKEQPAYILNSLLVPFLDAALELWGKGVADPQIIDKTWMVATGAPLGPFGFIDVIGINTAFNIRKMKADATQDPVKILTVKRLKEEFLDLGKLGTSSGEGFYQYPNPAYKDKDFLK